jgi:translation initiation factor 2 beta subunit (eIF-2beta)/eIF-5
MGRRFQDNKPCPICKSYEREITFDQDEGEVLVCGLCGDILQLWPLGLTVEEYLENIPVEEKAEAKYVED